MPRPRHATLLLIGDGFSAFGGWIDFLAILTLAAWQFHVSPLQMALVSAAGLLPGMVAGPAVGRWCDRGPTQRLLMGSIAGRLLATGAILACHDFVAFLALVGLRSLFTTVAPPAINVLAMRSVAAEERPRFFSLLNVINNSAKVLAPALGTVSASMASEAWALGLSLLFSAAALVVFAGLRAVDDAPAAAPAAGSAEAERATLWPLLWLTATCAFFVFMVNNLVPLVLQRAAVDKAWLGLLVSSSGAGNIVSGLWLARRAKTHPLRGVLGEMGRPALAQALGFGALGLLLAGRPPAVEWLMCALFFAIGTASARYAIAMSVFVSTRHAAAVGTTWGAIQAGQNTMILLAPLLGALVFERWGAAALFGVATGVGVLSLAALGGLTAVPGDRGGGASRQAGAAD
jgi:MFS family permease